MASVRCTRKPTTTSVTEQLSTMHALGALASHDALCGGAAIPVSVRYIPDLKRIYVEPATGSNGLGACATLTQIWENLPQLASPLYAINTTTSAVSEVPTGTWLLTEDLYIEDGITLSVVGEGGGGDADELRLLSNSETFLNLRGNGGSLVFQNTRVWSWDEAMDGPDEDISDGRSYVSCLSEIVTDESLSCAGRAERTVGECRMDIHNSEMAYLGYDAPEAWGLSSIVRGFCSDKSNPEIFDSVGVHGTIYASDLHHNYHGYYTLGNLAGDWKGNTVHDNFQDGFHAREYSRRLMIAGNDVYDNGNHGIVGSEWSSDLTILQNIVYGNRIGISLHRMGDRAVVQLNYVNVCSEAGIALLESSHGIISGNVLLQSLVNLRVSVGSNDNIFENNVIRKGKKYEISVYEGSSGSDLPVYRDSGRPDNNIFCKNKFEGPRHDDGGVHIANADGTQFVENLIFDGPWHFNIENSQSFVFSGNHGYERVDVSLDSESCVDPVSDFGEAVCEDSHAVLYQPSDLSLHGKLAVADMYLDSFDGAGSPSSNPSSSSSTELLADNAKLTSTAPAAAAAVVAVSFRAERGT